MIGSISDRLLSRIVPKAQASATYCYTQRTNIDGRVVCRECCANMHGVSCGNWSMFKC